MWAKHIAGRKFLTMPFPAAWKDGLLRENYAGLARSEVLTCQAMIEQLRHDGYAVVGLAEGAQPRLSDRFLFNGGNVDAGMVLDFIITADGGPNEILGC